MKILTVTYKEFNGNVLTSLCEYNTETKEKNYISIPYHIAYAISDTSTAHKVNETLSSCRLKRYENPNFQD